MQTVFGLKGYCTGPTFSFPPNNFLKVSWKEIFDLELITGEKHPYKLTFILYSFVLTEKFP